MRVEQPHIVEFFLIIGPAPSLILRLFCPQLDASGNKLSDVIITIDTPVYNITDQAGFIDLVREAVLTVNQDNAFMTLIDYDNIELVLPSVSSTYKAEPMLCCHSCPDGHAYRLGNCGERVTHALPYLFLQFSHS